MCEGESVSEGDSWCVCVKDGEGGFVLKGVWEIGSESECMCVSVCSCVFSNY